MNTISSFLRHIFTPREENDYKAKALHPDVLTYYLAFAILLTFFIRFINGNLSNVLGFATDISIPRLYELTNEQRTTKGLSALQYNEKLAVAAQKKAQDMFAKNYWAHFAPDGTTPWSFMLSSDYQYEFAGENLAKNFIFSQAVVEAWMDSPSHRENILRGDYTEVGYAVVNGVLNGEETTLVVQMFGKPLGPIALNQVAKPIEAETIPQAVVPTVSAIIPTIQTIPADEISIQKAAAQPVILGNQAQTPMNLLPTILSSNIIFFIFLLVAIAMDFYFAARINVIRVGGKHLAHFIFIGFIVAGLLMSLIKGAIL